MKTNNQFITSGVILACLAIAVSTRAQTLLSGNISGTWSPSGNPYIATDNCTIPAGRTLTIQPGVMVEIGSGLSITNNGLILAMGSPSQRITFQAPVSSQYWNTIWNNYSGSTNIFTYCDFQNANTALGMSIDNSGNSTMVTEILNCTFSNCLSQAIFGLSGGETNNPIIKNCTFNNTSNGCVMITQWYYGSVAQFVGKLGTKMAA